MKQHNSVEQPNLDRLLTVRDASIAVKVIANKMTTMDECREKDILLASMFALGLLVSSAKGGEKDRNG